ncbi:hypothetical protein DSO57_1028145 [Entomophthora muscae]|uniref:Uncharacterized protein n=1 Tax=Entomophthora muscae TaxID=34485 RepID=A0ACC2SE59_9FUNG|nr:hypothetical protein DSO57_1028145 [Entomophthora muscae]
MMSFFQRDQKTLPGTFLAPITEEESYKFRGDLSFDILPENLLGKNYLDLSAHNACIYIAEHD